MYNFFFSCIKWRLTSSFRRTSVRHLILEVEDVAVLGVDEREVLASGEQTVKIVIGVRVKRARRVARREPDLALHEIAREAAAQTRRKLKQTSQFIDVLDS